MCACCVHSCTENIFIRYTFCGLATMILINEVNRLDLPRLIVRIFFIFLFLSLFDSDWMIIHYLTAYKCKALFMQFFICVCSPVYNIHCSIPFVMVTMNKLFKCDFLLYQDWLVFRQGKECGFQGRTNKLVDGCYSFWQVIFYFFLLLVPRGFYSS